MKRFCLIAVFTLAVVACQECIGAYITVVNNGPSSNRVDAVFLGDGYTTADHAAGTYDNHINEYLNYIFTDTQVTDPFYRYRNYFNVHKIEVASNESGADDPNHGIVRDTALDASYNDTPGFERLLTVSEFKADATLAAGLSGAGFSAEMKYVTVNSTKYGGSGGDYAVYAGGNSAATEIALHEIAHSFNDLADEYPLRSYSSEPSAVNITLDSTGAKWSRWLGYEQPVVGTIGANDIGGNLYRPTNNSKMRYLDRPFDAIAREKIILDIYDLVDPFDSWRSNSVPLFDPGDLFVERIDDDVISMQWFVDGGLVPFATGDTFNLADFGYGPGTYEVSARGYDPTAFDPIDGWVRINQSELEQFISWDVTLSSSSNLAAVPEPTSLHLLLLAVTGGVLRTQKRRLRKSTGSVE